MKRAIIAPPGLAPAALGELKQWLAITTAGEDAALGALLLASLETCEAFTGLMPLEAECEEVLPANGGWRALATRPVEAVTGVFGIPAEGARFALPPQDYMLELDADGTALVRVLQQGAAGRIAVRFTAGLAPGWAELPGGLRHGVLRLAAHHYRERESRHALADAAGRGRRPVAALAPDARGMIEASTDSEPLVARLVGKARTIAAARLSVRRRDPRRWRRAGWLWPLFARER